MKRIFIQVSVSKELKEEIRESAKELGLTMSAYLIMCHKKLKRNSK